MISWFRKAQPAVAPLRDYWVTVEVRLEPSSQLEDGTPIVGYFRVIGLRATPDAVRDMIRGCVTDGSIIWEETEIQVVDVRSMQRSVTKPLRSPFGAGIWHQTGRVYFPTWDRKEHETLSVDDREETLS